MRIKSGKTFIAITALFAMVLSLGFFVPKTMAGQRIVLTLGQSDTGAAANLWQEFNISLTPCNETSNSYMSGLKVYLDTISTGTYLGSISTLGQLPVGNCNEFMRLQLGSDSIFITGTHNLVVTDGQGVTGSVSFSIDHFGYVSVNDTDTTNAAWTVYNADINTPNYSCAGNANGVLCTNPHFSFTGSYAITSSSPVSWVDSIHQPWLAKLFTKIAKASSVTKTIGPGQVAQFTVTPPATCTLNLSITGNAAPVSYKVAGPNQNYTGQIPTNSQTVTYNNVPQGNYTVMKGTSGQLSGGFLIPADTFTANNTSQSCPSTGGTVTFNIYYRSDAVMQVQ